MFSISSLWCLKTAGPTLPVAAVIAVALMVYATKIRASIVATAATLRSAKTRSHSEIAECATVAQFADGAELGSNQRNVRVEASVRPRISQFKQAGGNQDQRLSAPAPPHAIVIDNVATFQHYTGKSLTLSGEDWSR